MSEVKTTTLIVDGNLSTSALDTHSMSVKGTLKVGNATDGCTEQYENFWGEMANRSFAVTRMFLSKL